MRSSANVFVNVQGFRGGATVKMPFDVRQKAYLAKILDFGKEQGLPKKRRTMKFSIGAGLPGVPYRGYPKRKTLTLPFRKRRPNPTSWPS